MAENRRKSSSHSLGRSASFQIPSASSAIDAVECDEVARAATTAEEIDCVSRLKQVARSATMSGFRVVSTGFHQMTGVLQQLGGSESGAVINSDTTVASSASATSSPTNSAAAAATAAACAGWITPKKYCPTDQMKSRALGQLDPALYLNEDAEEHYDQGPGHVGRLWFVLRYTQDTEQLIVCVRKARNLRPRLDQLSGGGSGGGYSGQAGDCCIRLSLENDDRRVLTTSVKRRTSNPNFDEKFCFQVPSSALETQTLRLTALQIDRQKRQKVIGHVSFPLRELLSLDRDCRIYRDLDSEAADVTENPEVKISLTFHAQLERITVGLHDCRNLPTKADSDEPIEVYLRVSMHTGLQGKEVKCKRTDCSSHGFNESLIFNKVTDINQTVIKVVMMLRGAGIGALFEKPIGSVILGSELFAKRKELEHWRAMSECPEQTVTHWHSMV